MIEIAEELVETVTMGQMLLPVAKVVLAELGGGIAMHLQDLRDGRVLGRHALRRTGAAHGGQPRASRHLAGDEGSPPGRARRLGVKGRQLDALIGYPVDIGRGHAHDVAAKAADIRIADIVSENDEDVGLFLVGHDHDLSK